MKIVIPGGSGQVGTVLSRAFRADGHDVVVLSRRPLMRPWRVVTWDGSSSGSWSSEVDGADVLINLAGRSVNCRYNATNRQQMVDSRVESTCVVGEAIAAAQRPPRVWLQAGTATIYAHRYDVANDETSGLLGGNEADAPDTWRFSIDVARAWERGIRHRVDAAYPKGGAPFGHDYESGCGWRVRHARETGEARTRRPRRRRPPVRLVDSRE